MYVHVHVSTETLVTLSAPTEHTLPVPCTKEYLYLQGGLAGIPSYMYIRVRLGCAVLPCLVVCFIIFPPTWLCTSTLNLILDYSCIWKVCMLDKDPVVIGHDEDS